MLRSLVAAGLLAQAACGRVGFDPIDDALDSSCATRTFGTPVLVDGVNSGTTADITLRLTATELDGLFWSLRSGGGDLYEAHRPDRASAFTVTALGAPINDPTSADADPTIAPDGSFVVFGSVRVGGQGGFDLYELPRIGAGFGTPNRLDVISSTGSDTQPNWSPAESALYFASNRDGLFHIYRAVRSGPGVYAPPVVVSELIADGEEFDATPSANGLVLFFRSSRAGGPGGTDAYVTTRPNLTAPFGPATLLDISSPAVDGPSFISPDLCRLYFTSDRSGATKIHVAER